MHPRLTINGVAFSNSLLPDDLTALANANLRRIGLQDRKFDQIGWDVALDVIRSSGLEVAYLIHTTMFTLDHPELWPRERERLTRTIEAAAALGTPLVYSMTGPGGTLTYEESAAAFATALAPALDIGRSHRVRVAIENQNQLRQENSIAYNLRDLVQLAELSGIGIVAEMYYTWREPQLAATVARAIPHLQLVQLSDYALGTMTMPDRVVPGDGVLPLERVIATFLDAGYEGFFDLELVGPRIDAEGILALERGAEYVSAMLERLGV